MVKKILAKVETEELVDILKNRCFLVLVDESTDRANKKSAFSSDKRF